MPLWKNTDAAANTPLYVPLQVDLSPNSTNQAALYNNATANAFFNGETIGVYGVTTAEMQAVRAAGLARPAHAGYVLVTQGSGGRNNRTMEETLVTLASGSMTGAANVLFEVVQLAINASANSTTLLTLSTGTTAGITNGMVVTGSTNTQVVNTGVASHVVSVANTTAFVVSATVVVANGTCNVQLYTSDNVLFPDAAMVITVEPVNASGNSTNNDVVHFPITAIVVPTGGDTIAYQWQKWGGSSFANLSNAGAYSNVTTSNLAVKANTASNAEIYRCFVYAADYVAANVLSSNAVITITT